MFARRSRSRVYILYSNLSLSPAFPPPASNWPHCLPRMSTLNSPAVESIPRCRPLIGQWRNNRLYVGVAKLDSQNDKSLSNTLLFALQAMGSGSSINTTLPPPPCIPPKRRHKLLKALTFSIYQPSSPITTPNILSPVSTSPRLNDAERLEIEAALVQLSRLNVNANFYRRKSLLYKLQHNHVGSPPQHRVKTQPAGFPVNMRKVDRYTRRYNYQRTEESAESASGGESCLSSTATTLTTEEPSQQDLQFCIS